MINYYSIKINVGKKQNALQEFFELFCGVKFLFKFLIFHNH